MAELVSVSPKTPKTPESTSSTESVEYQQCMSVYVFSEVAGFGYKNVDGIHLQTYCGGPEGGYLMSVTGQLYTVHRDWGVPFTLTPIEGTLVLITEGDPDRIRLLKVGEELLEDETEFEWEEWHQEKWAKAKENYAEACLEVEASESSTPTASEPPTPKSPKPPSSSDTKVVRVTYVIEDEFLVPKGLDLEDKSQVKEWEVRYNTLRITKADDTELKIESGGLIDAFSVDLKFPDTTTIIPRIDSFCYNPDNDEEDEDGEEREAESSEATSSTSPDVTSSASPAVDI